MGIWKVQWNDVLDVCMVIRLVHTVGWWRLPGFYCLVTWFKWDTGQSRIKDQGDLSKKTLNVEYSRFRPTSDFSVNYKMNKCGCKGFSDHLGQLVLFWQSSFESSPMKIPERSIVFSCERRSSSSRAMPMNVWIMSCQYFKFYVGSHLTQKCN